MTDIFIVPPEISVIIPTCGRLDLLRRAVHSLATQGVSGLEVIVVDDSAEGLEPSVLKDLELFQPIKYYRNEQFAMGPGYSRNKGVSLATAELIAFLDDDDFYLPNRLKEMSLAFDQSKYSFVSSGRFNEIENLREIRQVKRQKFGTIFQQDILYANTIDIGILTRKDLFISLGGFDCNLTSLEDWDLFLRLLKNKNGLKIERFDHVVNTSIGRNNVSMRDFLGYEQLATKHGCEFGSHWEAFMHATAARIQGSYSIQSALKLAYRFRSFSPITVKVKMFLSKFRPRLEARRSSLCTDG